jgi:hypothetical protein
MFAKTAEFYDLVYSFKSYEDEVRKIKLNLTPIQIKFKLMQLMN